jgi:hypothetical protein
VPVDVNVRTVLLPLTVTDGIPVIIPLYFAVGIEIIPTSATATNKKIVHRIW